MKCIMSDVQAWYSRFHISELLDDSHFNSTTIEGKSDP